MPQPRLDAQVVRPWGFDEHGLAGGGTALDHAARGRPVRQGLLRCRPRSRIVGQRADTALFIHQHHQRLPHGQLPRQLPQNDAHKTRQRVHLLQRKQQVGHGAPPVGFAGQLVMAFLQGHQCHPVSARLAPQPRGPEKHGQQHPRNARAHGEAPSHPHPAPFAAVVEGRGEQLVFHQRDTVLAAPGLIQV
ncbi:hypothetical protein D3C71_1564450 [compost metagenome]